MKAQTFEVPVSATVTNNAKRRAAPAHRTADQTEAKHQRPACSFGYAPEAVSINVNESVIC